MNETKIFSKSTTKIAYILSDKTASSLKGSALVVFLVHVVLLNFSDAFKWCPIQSGHGVVAILPLVCVAGQQGVNNASVEMKESFYGHISSATAEMRD